MAKTAKTAATRRPSPLTRDNLGFLLAKASQRWNELLAERFAAAGFPEVRPSYGSILVPLYGWRSASRPTQMLLDQFGCGSLRQKARTLASPSSLKCLLGWRRLVNRLRSCAYRTPENPMCSNFRSRSRWLAANRSY